MPTKEQVKQEILVFPGVQDFIKYAQNLFKDNFVGILATGSRTKGEYSIDSDLDLDIIVKNEMYAYENEIKDLESKISDFPKIIPWVKPINQLENPQEYLRTDTPFNKFELDGYSDLCKHVFWTDVKKNGLILLPDDSKILENMPECPQIPFHEGYELYTIATRDLLRGIVESKPNVLAKAILRAASAEHIFNKRSITNYSDAAQIFIDSINHKKNKYVKYVAAPNKSIRVKRNGFRNSKMLEFQEKRELYDYTKLVGEALQVKLGKKEKLSFENRQIIEFFEFIKNRTIDSYSREDEWAENLSRGTTYHARTAPKIVELLYKGLTENKIDDYFLDKYMNDIQLVLMANNCKKSIDNMISADDTVEFDWSLIRNMGYEIAKELNSHAVGGLTESCVELYTYGLSEKDVENAKWLLKKSIEDRQKEADRFLNMSEYEQMTELKKTRSLYGPKISLNLQIIITNFENLKKFTLDEKLLLGYYEDALKDIDDLPIEPPEAEKLFLQQSDELAKLAFFNEVKKNSHEEYKFNKMIMNTMLKANVYWLLNKVEDAKQTLKKLLEDIPEDIQFLGASGHSFINNYIGNLMRKQNPKEAIEYYNAIIRQNQSNFCAYISKANILAYLRKYEDSIATLEQARKVRPALGLIGWQLYKTCAVELKDTKRETLALLNLGMNYPHKSSEAITRFNELAQTSIDSGDFEFANFCMNGLQILGRKYAVANNYLEEIEKKLDSKRKC